MDFAEIQELDHILVPATSYHPAKLPQAQTEEELVNAFKTVNYVFNLSPKLSTNNVNSQFQIDLKEGREERQKSDEMDFSKAADLAGDAETNIASKESTKDKSGSKEKMKMKTQTFRDYGPLLDPPSRSIEIPADDWIKSIVHSVISGAVLSIEKSSDKLIADDTNEELLRQRAIFIKVPLKETKKQNKPKSLLTKLLGSATPKNGKGFILTEPPYNDPNRQKLRVFLLGTPRYLETVISKEHRVGDIIRHIMTIYSTSPLAKDAPLEFPDDTNAYELRLLEDDTDEYYLPLYEIAALDKKKKIGEFDVDMVAFCKVRRYTSQNITASKAAEDAKYKQLEKIAIEQGKVVLKVHCNFEKDATVIHMIEDPDVQLYEVLQRISTKRMEELKPELYRFCAYSVVSKQRMHMDLLKYSSMNNASVFDMKTKVRNLPTTELLLVERMYGDRTAFMRKRRSVVAASRTPSDLSKMQQLLNETLMADKEKNKKREYDNLYTKYNVSSYDEFDAYKVKPNGKKSKVILGIDGTNLYCGKEKTLTRSPVSKKYNLFKHKKQKQSVIPIPIKTITRVERAIYDDRKFYLWYDDPRCKGCRIDLETFDPAVTHEILGRIQFISKKIKCSFPIHKKEGTFI